jgi:hypothetical protein
MLGIEFRYWPVNVVFYIAAFIYLWDSNRDEDLLFDELLGAIFEELLVGLFICSQCEDVVLYTEPFGQRLGLNPFGLNEGSVINVHV